MSIDLTIDNQTYVYPSENQSPGYGEDATAWAEKVTEKINSIAPAGSISLTSFALLGSQTATNITGFILDGASVLAFSAFYYVTRTSAGQESGIITGHYTGSAWDFRVEPTGDASIDFDITSLGQVTYDTSGADAVTIKFLTTTVITA